MQWNAVYIMLKFMTCYIVVLRVNDIEALNFLRNSRTPRTTAYTDIVEECCKEGCAVEEIHEYCW